MIATADCRFLVVQKICANEHGDGPAAIVVLSRRYNASGRPVGGEEVVDGLDGPSVAATRATLSIDGGWTVT